MELNIVHLYPDVMSLYGEYANLAVLRRHLEALGVTVAVKAVTCEDAPGFTDADFIYMGAGTERGQKYVLEKLRPCGDSLKEEGDEYVYVVTCFSDRDKLLAHVQKD